ncbi:MAG: tetratricopeptide repeat protein [Formosimonas sp.]
MMNVRSSFFILATLFAATTALAKPSAHILLDPATQKPLPHTPYFMVLKGEKVKGIAYTDANGKTQATSRQPDILVQAEGTGKELLLVNLKEAQIEQAGKASVPYIIYNPVSHQALCAHANAKGDSHAYFMDDAQLWYKNALMFERQTNASCAQARTDISPLLNSDSEKFLAAYESGSSSVLMSKKQKKQLLYAHVSNLIDDKKSDFNSKAAQKTLDLAANTASDEQNSMQLNSIGYSLGIERQNYKQGLRLLDEALLISPNDCYATNSKGYLLMRSGKIEQSREYFEASDKSCKEAAKTGSTNTYDYPITVNTVHLAENYALLGDVDKANAYFLSALKIGSAKAEREISEVARNLIKSKVLSASNQRLYAAYLQWIERKNAP